TLALVWIAPVAAREIAKLTFLPLGFLALVAIFLMIVMRVRAEHTERTARRSLGSTQQASPA
ncbi:MAG TPA: hypothetical protein VKB15_06700, partial [Xanthobacteraceae bacterium]|nr:hypothetical protein [Xanthobacteraceae bacterium]